MIGSLKSVRKNVCESLKKRNVMQSSLEFHGVLHVELSHLEIACRYAIHDLANQDCS